jgi:hypothetical protein
MLAVSKSPPIFTHSPRQHPNLIIGALHLLCWMVFHPTAFRNYLTSNNSKLTPKSSLSLLLRQGCWRDGKNFKFLLQSLVILPLLGALFVAAIELLVGVPFLRVAFGVAFGTVGGMAFGVAFGMAFDVAFAVAYGVAFAVAYGVAGGVVSAVGGGMTYGVSVCAVVGAVAGVAFGVARGAARGVAISVVRGIACSVAIGVVVGVVGGAAEGVTFGGGYAVPYGVGYGVAFGATVGVGVLIHHWLPYLLYPILQISNYLLFRLDASAGKKRRLWLRWHSVGWYEWEYLPLYGLDKHLILATELSPELGAEAISFVSTTKQQWAAKPSL